MSKTWQDYKRLPHSHSFQNDTTIIVGDMVKINSLLGVVRFIGTTDFKTGTWAGIELDQIGLGKNDGSVDGECAPILTFFSKRYFHCPSKTGLFAPVAKLVKINRPNTPHQKANIYAGDDDITSLHKKIETLTAENEFLKLKQPSLQKQLVELEADHLRVLAEKNDELQAKEEEILKLNLVITEVKQAGLDSLEMLESIVQRHQKKVNFLEQELANEKNKRQVLLLEQENLRNAGLEAVESNESALNQLESVKQHWSSEKKKLEHEFESSQTKLMQLHHHEIKTLLQDINVLEIVLQSKIDKENVLSQSLKREKSYSNKILIDAKSNKLHIKTKSRSSFNSFNDHRISAYHYHTPLDTPIEEEEEDLASCTLCGMDGHDLFHCSILPNRRHTIHPHLS